jgi:tetratricopeptide (TPR) repeat protein
MLFSSPPDYIFIIFLILSSLFFPLSPSFPLFLSARKIACTSYTASLNARCCPHYVAVAIPLHIPTGWQLSVFLSLRISSPLGEHHKAIEFQERCLAIAREAGDRTGEGRAYCNLGAAYALLGEYGKAIEFQARRLAIAREVGNRAGEGFAFGNLGHAYIMLGEHGKGIEFQEQSLAIAREVGDRTSEGRAYWQPGRRLQHPGRARQCD